MIINLKDKLNSVLSSYCNDEMSNPFISGKSNKEMHCLALFDSLNNSLENELHADAAMIILQFAILFNGR